MFGAPGHRYNLTLWRVIMQIPCHTPIIQWIDISLEELTISNTVYRTKTFGIISKQSQGGIMGGAGHIINKTKKKHRSQNWTLGNPRNNWEPVGIGTIDNNPLLPVWKVPFESLKKIWMETKWLQFMNEQFMRDTIESFRKICIKHINLPSSIHYTSNFMKDWKKLSWNVSLVLAYAALCGTRVTGP